MCQQYGDSLLNWMRANPDRWGEFLTEKEFPKKPDFKKVMISYGKTLSSKFLAPSVSRISSCIMNSVMFVFNAKVQVMTGGCKGFGKTIMEWPEDLIIGGS